MSETQKTTTTTPTKQVAKSGTMLAPVSDARKPDVPMPDAKIAIEATIDAFKQAAITETAKNRKEQEHSFAFLVLAARNEVFYPPFGSVYLPGAETKISVDGRETVVKASLACKREAIHHLLHRLPYDKSGRTGMLDPTGTRIPVPGPGKDGSDEAVSRSQAWLNAIKQVSAGVQLAAQLHSLGVKWTDFNQKERMFEVPLSAFARKGMRPLSIDPNMRVLLDRKGYGFTDASGKLRPWLPAAVTTLQAAWNSHHNVDDTRDPYKQRVARIVGAVAGLHKLVEDMRNADNEDDDIGTPHMWYADLTNEGRNMLTELYKWSGEAKRWYDSYEVDAKPTGKPFVAKAKDRAAADKAAEDKAASEEAA